MHLLKALTCLVLIALAQNVTQAQIQINIPKMPNMPNIPNIPNVDTRSSGDKKYILADARKHTFVPSTINMHQNDIIVFVGDKSDDSWKTFSYYVNQNQKKCEKDPSAGSASIGKGSSNDGFSSIGSFSSSLAPGSFYFAVGYFNNVNKCRMNLTAIVVADDKPTTDTPYPNSNSNSDTDNNVNHNWIKLVGMIVITTVIILIARKF